MFYSCTGDLDLRRDFSSVFFLAGDLWLFCEADAITDLVSADNFADICEP